MNSNTPPVITSARRKKRLKKIGAWILAVLIAYGLWYLAWGTPRAKTQSVLNWIELGKLPASAKNIRYHSWHGLGTGETCAKFELSTEDIQRFITKASALTNWKGEVLSPSHQLIPMSENNRNNFASLDHDYIPSVKFPQWFDMSVRKRGVKFDHVIGSTAWVVINEESNTVFLWVVAG